MPATSKTPLSQILVAFHEDATFCSISKRLGVSPSRLRVLWKEHYGAAAFERRCRSHTQAPEGAEEAALLAFATEEPFKGVAKRLGMSPNTLRELWKAKFGADAFLARAKSSHVRAGVKSGLAGVGRKKNIAKAEASCSSCGSIVVLNLIQKARSKLILCESCKDQKRGVDLRCPVCDLGCVGRRALTQHLAKPQTGGREAHAAYLSKQESVRWQGLHEGVDYVVCQMCLLKAFNLTHHVKTHGLTAQEYYAKFPDGCMTPSLVESKRRKALQGYYEDISYNWSREDLVKYTDEQGRVIVAEAALDLNASASTVLLYCRKYGLPTRNRLAWQRITLDMAAKAFRASYEWEWSDPRIVNPITGRVLHFDGYFPKLNLIVEAHGDQHTRYSEAWHGSLALFSELRDRDAFKKQKAEELGFRVIMVRPSDPIHEASFWLNLLGKKPEPVDIDPIFQRLREGGFPEVAPQDVELRKALTRLVKIDGYVDDHGMVYPYSTVGTAACASFFPMRYHAKHKGSMSAYEAWQSESLLRKAIQLQVDSGHPTTPERVLRALVMYHRTPSVFRPLIAKFVCSKFAPSGVVWDPCAGYGGRLLGAVASKVSRYIGTDVEQATVEGNRKLAEVLGAAPRCQIVQARAEMFDPGETLDLVFTSPPYFDVEVYGNASNELALGYGSAHGWVRKFLHPVMVRAADRLHAGGHLVLNLPHRPVQGVRLDLEALSLAQSLGLTSLPTLWMPVRTFKGTMKGEPLLIWRK